MQKMIQIILILWVLAAWIAKSLLICISLDRSGAFESYRTLCQEIYHTKIITKNSAFTVIFIIIFLWLKL